MAKKISRNQTIAHSIQEICIHEKRLDTHKLGLNSLKKISKAQKKELHSQINLLELKLKHMTEAHIRAVEKRFNRLEMNAKRQTTHLNRLETEMQSLDIQLSESDIFNPTFMTVARAAEQMAKSTHQFLKNGDGDKP